MLDKKQIILYLGPILYKIATMNISISFYRAYYMEHLKFSIYSVLANLLLA